MNFQHAIHILSQLGTFFKEESTKDNPVFTRAYQQNPWFTIEYTKKAIAAWGDQLSTDHLNKWLSVYQDMPQPEPKNVVVIMAGNIPLVGLHDLLSILVCGHKAIVKLSSDDNVLMKWVIENIINIAPEWTDKIEITDERLPKNFDAVIATGSNNTNRYFEYYFKTKPSLLRKARTSVAVLTGNETPEDLQKLGEDIFTYFGLGCRNVSKIYVPEGYDIVHFYEGIADFYEHINHNKYANNYTYHKAILLMNLTKHFDNNFLLLKEDTNIASPLGVMFYEQYTNLDELSKTLDNNKDQIQCVVSNISLNNSVPLGKAQQPELTDYADGVDTVKFLLEI
jgi:hypothetical protein